MKDNAQNVKLGTDALMNIKSFLKTFNDQNGTFGRVCKIEHEILCCIEDILDEEFNKRHSHKDLREFREK